MGAAEHQFIRQRGRCEYCKLPQEFSELRFHVEHIIPRQHGGGDSADNLALACPECNLKKGPNLAGLDPQSGRLTKLFNPRQQRWDDHFVWNGSQIDGRTNVGRATVRVLDLNSSQRLRVRGYLAKLGVIPPS